MQILANHTTKIWIAAYFQLGVIVIGTATTYYAMKKLNKIQKAMLGLRLPILYSDLLFSSMTLKGINLTNRSFDLDAY